MSTIVIEFRGKCYVHLNTYLTKMSVDARKFLLQNYFYDHTKVWSSFISCSGYFLLMQSAKYFVQLLANDFFLR